MSDGRDGDHPEPEACSRDFKDQLQEMLDVLAAHSRILEKHAGSLDTLKVLLTKIQTDIAITKADIASINNAQKIQNQLTVSIHQLWSRLKCVAPESDQEKKPDMLQDADGFRRRSASSEIRQLSMLLSDRGDDDED